MFYDITEPGVFWHSSTISAWNSGWPGLRPSATSGPANVGRRPASARRSLGEVRKMHQTLVDGPAVLRFSKRSETCLTGIWSKARGGSVVVLRLADALPRAIDGD
jgi:hypothetical protein